ncbi:hypothetical protein BWQ96_09329 [Gracilariopsis chorda]|uniref:Uncharacterized protein n=1 Tax=Gracilariopsis chorda TaxID=448386 RepID=A0A2V3IFS5_9FLOR|nr:hypothetical protein BWQ96_09329 [Gracilariopsis chorda]|eukprot:PXF40934.1 hypothetical protein BWQ96_09329 [Gracilariopsis chorda]
MAVELPSFTSIPDAPTISTILPGVSQNDPFHTQIQQNPNFIPITTAITEAHKQVHPRLELHAYNNRLPNNAHNVLSLIHNGVKREIADLLTIVLPGIQHHAAITSFSCRIKDAPVFGDRLYQWWSTLLRVFFYTAETDEDILNIVMKPVTRYARRNDDSKTAAELQRRQKSVLDRYSFTMEVVLRAADRALDDYECVPDAPKLSKLVHKLSALADFMLDTMDLTLHVVHDALQVCDVDIASLEYTVANSMSAFAKGNPGVFTYIFARWMEDENDVRKWIAKFGGLRGRLFFESWKRAHHEKRGSIINQIADMYISSVE